MALTPAELNMMHEAEDRLVEIEYSLWRIAVIYTVCLLGCWMTAVSFGASFGQVAVVVMSGAVICALVLKRHVLRLLKENSALTIRAQLLRSKLGRKFR